MNSPYQGLPKKSFWKTAVDEVHPLALDELYKKKFDILPDHKIATGGSCFAQHVASRLRTSGYAVMDKEPAPIGMPKELATHYGFGLYSARYGNIYTAKQLLQLSREAFGQIRPSLPVWTRPDGRLVDAQRPNIEPKGFGTEEEISLHRRHHLSHVKTMLSDMDVFIFTLGLTESWAHLESGTIYPTAPGTIASPPQGIEVPDFEFVNFSANETVEQFKAFRELVQQSNPKCKFILTVSPVPLTATASGQHVAVATMYSKSALRAAAGELYGAFDDVDYFPSYEIINSPITKGFFFDKNMRTVSSQGVDFVMSRFLCEHPPVGQQTIGGVAAEVDLSCEDALLEAFS